MQFYKLISTRSQNYNLFKNFNYHHYKINVYYISNSNKVFNKGFFGNFIDNLKQDFERNKEMKENIKKFKEEKRRLEQSDALKEARRKFNTIEAETNKNTEQLKKQFDSIKNKLEQTFEDAQKSKIGKIVTKELAEKTKNVRENIIKQTENLNQNQTFTAIKKSVKQIKNEVEDSAILDSKLYQSPKKLLKRSDYKLNHDERHIKPDTYSTGVEIHKDSKWANTWENFKENNAYMSKLLEFKTKYDESDNSIVKASKLITDKFNNLFSGLFSNTEISTVLTEICKIDPNFDKNEFLKFCETVIIPNILEAILRGDLDILKDWCHEGPFNTLSQPIKEAIKLNYQFCSKVLDIENIELVMGKLMDQGPVLVISFQSQQVMIIKDKNGKLIEGDLEKIHRVNYIWVLCRDQNELNPKAAWKLIDISANSVEQWL